MLFTIKFWQQLLYKINFRFKNVIEFDEVGLEYNNTPSLTTFVNFWSVLLWKSNNCH